MLSSLHRNRIAVDFKTKYICGKSSAVGINNEHHFVKMLLCPPPPPNSIEQRAEGGAKGILHTDGLFD